MDTYVTDDRWEAIYIDQGGSYGPRIHRSVSRPGYAEKQKAFGTWRHDR